ncbi:rab9 effector protein with kelch motifs isoform X4 [Oncorhynchus clarkii lewisi]|uniref:rab9 effector protein with kelch motifs isoform X4 n=2 Tax=Oncorhynchus clarkii lewisi TaxID=490388 RepID=UPI0039B8A899
MDASHRMESMELLPVLEPEDKPRAGLWYAMIPRGGGPGVSVGHTCIYIPSEDDGKGKIQIIGGANPNGSFSESHVINLDSHEWDIPEWEGLEARYEHCSFVPESCPQSLWVFAGAQQSGNRNCVQNLQLTGGGLWKGVEVKGTPPCPRTYHTNSASVGDRLFVFSGGDSGATPVSDPNLHVFDTVSCTWSQPDTQGRHPPARHGHVVTAVGPKIYIHGGMAGEKFYSDIYSLDTSSMKWEKVQAKGDIPPGVAAHSAVALGKNIYIFGGMTPEGASNAMYRFQCDKQRWTLLRFEGNMPPNRLDHSMCVLPWRVRPEHTSGERDQAQSSSASGTVQLAFVFGGMDTQGVIHSDCVVTVLT